MTTASQQIGEYVAAIRPDSLSDDLVQRVAFSFVDTFAVAVAGSHEPAARITRDYVSSIGRAGHASLWGTADLAAAEDAALANGVAGHALDYDDVAFPLTGHPSVVLLPALVAVAEAEGATGGQVAAGYYVGYEVAQKLGRVIATSHYARGWHCTATIGVIAAAAACSQLLQLGARETAAAVGIAAAQVAGVRRSFGTMTKPLQAGNAAAAGVRAARLAAHGLTSPIDALDGPSGFMDVYGNGEDLGAELEHLGEWPPELIRNGVFVKKYPCCYDAQRAVQATLELVGEQPIDPDAVVTIRAQVHPTGLTALMHPRPTTGLEAKFSLEYGVAAALLDRSVGLASFTDEAVRRPAAQALLAKVQRSEDTGDPLPHRARVEVDVSTGARRARRVETVRGSPQSPLAAAELEAKLQDCVAFGHLRMDVSAFFAAVRDWRQRSVRNILAIAKDGM